MTAEVKSSAGKHRNRLIIVMAVTSTYLVVEVVAGVLTRSLALIADAGHMLTDVFGLGLALFAIWFGARPATPQRTYGYYRAEILAATVNALILFGISGYILFEAWKRFQAPPEVESGPMMIVATIGLGINIFGAFLLFKASGESLNMRGAFFEVVSDMLGSIGVILAGAIIYFTGWQYADPLISVAIGLFILPRTWNLLREAVGVLLEGTPSEINLASVEQMLLTMPKVEKVHDLHVWSLTSGMNALSVHVTVGGGHDADGLLEQINTALREQFKIDHSTIQIETVDRQQQEAAI